MAKRRLSVIDLTTDDSEAEWAKAEDEAEPARKKTATTASVPPPGVDGDLWNGLCDWLASSKVGSEDWLWAAEALDSLDPVAAACRRTCNTKKADRLLDPLDWDSYWLRQEDMLAGSNDDGNKRDDDINNDDDNETDEPDAAAATNGHQPKLHWPLEKNSSKVLDGALRKMGRVDGAQPSVNKTRKVEILLETLNQYRSIRGGAVLVGIDVGLRNLGWSVVVRLADGSVRFLDTGVHSVLSDTSADKNKLFCISQVHQVLRHIVDSIPLEFTNLSRRFLVEKQTVRYGKQGGPAYSLLKNYELESILLTMMYERDPKSVVQVDPGYVSSHWDSKHPPDSRVQVHGRDLEQERQRYKNKKLDAPRLIDTISKEEAIVDLAKFTKQMNHHNCDAALISLAWADWMGYGLSL
ncbi:hypothetical protein HDU79_006191 [Rhizoclosmatium sp. JEL0117]|nr:hypothetical protein HDU79_006191 [Rhizoclosmatium sp. JEL0117]